MAFHDITGYRTGLLVAEEPLPHRGTNSRYWKWRCDCGGETHLHRQAATITGHCGCLTAERLAARHRTHGASATNAYKAWHAMIERCQNKKNMAYPSYGGRGIRVCERWKSYTNFLADMGERPAGVTLDRIDNDGDYEPSNCRWATKKQQQRNRRSNRILAINGVEMCVAEWCEKYGMPRSTVQGRLRKKWPAEAALTTPINAKMRNGRAHGTRHE